LDNAEENLQTLLSMLGSDASAVFALDPVEECCEFTAALRALGKANSDEEEAALRRL